MRIRAFSADSRPLSATGLAGWGVLCLVYLCVAAGPALAGDEVSAWRQDVAYHAFASSSMNDVYQGAFITTSRVCGSRDRLDISFGVGWIHADGRPRTRTSNWILDESRISMKTLSLDVEVIRRLGSGRGALFEPFVGGGPVLFLGSERLSAEASRVRAGVSEGFSDELVAFRVSYGLAATLGTRVRFGRKAHAVAGLRGMLAASAGGVDLYEDEEKQEEVFRTHLYQVVQRPSFNMSGWGGFVGIQWNWGVE